MQFSIMADGIAMLEFNGVKQVTALEFIRVTKGNHVGDFWFECAYNQENSLDLPRKTGEFHIRDVSILNYQWMKFLLNKQHNFK